MNPKSQPQISNTLESSKTDETTMPIGEYGLYAFKQGVFQANANLDADDSLSSSENANDVIKEFCFPKNELASLAQVSRYSRSLFQPILDQRAAIQLVQHVVNGDAKKVEQMLDANPRLLKITVTSKARKLKSTIISPAGKRKNKNDSGKIIANVTAFQAALCEIDDDMAVMIQKYFAQLENGEAEYERQYREIFPEGAEKYFSEQKPYDLSKLLDAIANSSNEDIVDALSCFHSSIYRKILEFKQEFAMLSYSEKVYNPQHMIAANQICDELYKLHYSQPNVWNLSRVDLFWRMVFGEIQHHQPMNIKQAYAEGLYNDACFKNKSNRSNRIYSPAKEMHISLFELADNLNYRIGIDFAISNTLIFGKGEACKHLYIRGPHFKNRIEYSQGILEDLGNSKRAVHDSNSSLQA